MDTNTTRLTLNLSEAARSFLHYNDQGSLSVWQALTGLEYEDAVAHAKELASADPDTLAAVAPF